MKQLFNVWYYAIAVANTTKTRKEAAMSSNLDVFFKNSLSPKEFALYVRKFMHASIMLNFHDENGSYAKDIEEGYYWLTEFAEHLDPLLTKEQ